MRIVALGASGNAGREIVALLSGFLADRDELVLAGRDANRLAATQKAVVGPATVSTKIVDATDFDAVRELVAGADLVLVTASRPDLVGELAQIVLDAGANWFDTMLSTPTKLDALRSLAPEIEQAGLCFVTDGGFHPGLPAALVRWAASELDVVTDADVMAGMRMDWRAETLADSTIEEMLDEFVDFDLTTWVDAERRQLRWAECPTIDFGEPIGRKVCVPMPLAEMEPLPSQNPGLRRCGFYIAGFGPVMDFVMLPILIAMTRVTRLRRAATWLTRWSLSSLASYRPPHRLVLQMEAHGHRSGYPATASVKVSSHDGYLLTAAPAVACLRRFLNEGVHHPGVHLQGHLLPPQQFLTDLADLGLSVEAKVVPTGMSYLGR